MARRRLDQGPLAVVIPTYRRPASLARLMGDLSRQTRRPDVLAVVDGSKAKDPAAGRDAELDGRPDAQQLLAELGPSAASSGRYLASNHANLPFQRWLGRLAVEDCSTLVYFDDDVRLADTRTIERLAAPLELPGSRVVGVTARIRFGFEERAKVRTRWGVTRGYKPGSLAPNGERLPAAEPAENGWSYAPLGWLRGGAMAIRVAALDRSCFPDDLFALAERGWGLGEDTVLALRLAARGELLLAREAEVLHPSEAPSCAYTGEPRGLGYATAYSRRLINDHYRGSAPRLSDRWALARSLLSGTLLHAFSRPRFALGFAAGAYDAVVRPPRSERLCPGIVWDREAEEAMECMAEFRFAPGALQSSGASA